MKTVVFAGQGKLPIDAVKNLKEIGSQVSVITFAEQAAVNLEGVADDITTMNIGKVGHILKYLENSGADSVSFAGKISREILDGGLKPDLKAIWMLFNLRDRQEDTIMLAIIEEIEKLNIKILSQEEVLHNLIAREGVYSKLKPSKAQLEDVAFGYEKEKGVAGLDIGQSIAVKNKTVLAVEAIESTDNCIKRAGTLCKGGFTVVKVAKPSQDPRFDVPVVGVDTLQTIAESGGAVLAVEADKTLIVDIDKCIEFANKNKLVFMAYKNGSVI